MTGVSEFTYVQHPSPATSAARDAVLAAPGFGKHFTDHMVSAQWTRERGWYDARLTAYAPLTVDPASVVLHYAQEVFEGLKAYRQPDGSVALFRPERNAARMVRSCARLARPPFPEDDFVAACRPQCNHAPGSMLRRKSSSTCPASSASSAVMVSSGLWLMPPLPQRVNSMATSVICAICIASWPAPDSKSKRGTPARSTAAPSASIKRGEQGAASASTIRT